VLFVPTGISRRHRANIGGTRDPKKSVALSDNVAEEARALQIMEGITAEHQVLGYLRAETLLRQRGGVYPPALVCLYVVETGCKPELHRIQPVGYNLLD
jgi:hypothetical protein